MTTYDDATVNQPQPHPASNSDGSEDVKAKELKWELYYWHHLPGRGDFVRLMFAEAGVEYKDVCREGKSSAEALKFYKGERNPDEFPDEFPVLSPPIIRNAESGFVLCQTPAILEYLGRHPDFHMRSLDDKAQAHAMQLNLTVADYIGEGHDAFHPVKKTASYDTQIEQAKPHIEAFVRERMPRYLNHFDKVLQKSKGKYFFSDDPNDEAVTYADIAVFHALRATKAQFKDEYEKLKFAKLEEFFKAMEKRDGIAEFLHSEKSQPFCGNSMM